MSDYQGVYMSSMNVRAFAPMKGIPAKLKTKAKKVMVAAGGGGGDKPPINNILPKVNNKKNFDKILNYLKNHPIKQPNLDNLFKNFKK